MSEFLVMVSLSNHDQPQSPASSRFDKLMLRQAQDDKMGARVMVSLSNHDQPQSPASSRFDKLMLRQAQHDKMDALVMVSLSNHERATRQPRHE